MILKGLNNIKPFFLSAKLYKMIKFEDYKFMSLGSNCADIWYLGPNRVLGPVDNVVVKSFNCILSLLNKTFFNKIFEEQFKIEQKTWIDNDDLTKILDYPDFKIVHNNPNTAKFKENLTIRLNNLASFITNMKETDYLVFNFNSYFIDENHMPTKEFIYFIAWLKNKNLLNKIIFVQLFTQDNNMDKKWNAHISPEAVKAFGLKTVDINNFVMSSESYEQFKQQFIALEGQK